MEIFRDRKRKYLIQWVCSSYSRAEITEYSSRLFLEYYDTTAEKGNGANLLGSVEANRIYDREKNSRNTSLLRGALVALGEKVEDHGFVQVVEISEALWWSRVGDLKEGNNEFSGGVTAKVSHDDAWFDVRIFSGDQCVESALAMLGDDLIGSRLENKVYPIKFEQEGLLEAWKLEHEVQGEALFPKEEADLFRAMGVPLPIFWEPKEAFAWLSEHCRLQGKLDSRA